MVAALNDVKLDPRNKQMTMKKLEKIIIGDYIIEAESRVSYIGPPNERDASRYIKFFNGRGAVYYDGDVIMVKENIEIC